MSEVAVTVEEEFRWVRPPVQARSQASLTRILDAAEVVIGERGFAAATVADIVRLAKSSVGVFYDRFKDKETLLDFLHERFCQESYATADEALAPERWKGASLDEVISKLVRFLVQIYRQHRGLLRAFMVRCGTDRNFADRGMKLHNYLAQKLSALLLSRENEIAHARPEIAVEFGLRIVGATLDSLVLYDEVGDSTFGLHDEETAEELTRAFLAYLGSSARRPQEVSRKKRPTRASKALS